jgi:predicted nuclease of predicted toxin-antitoxin system
MKAVVDEDLSRSFGVMLRECGYEVFDIRDHGLRGKPDEDVFRFAQEQRATLFSGDLDFANTLRFPLGEHNGIVIIRFPNEIPTRVIDAEVGILLAKLTIQDIPGNLVILEPRRIRIRRHKKF